MMVASLVGPETPTSALLSTGKVLIAGGSDAFDSRGGSIANAFLSNPHIAVDQRTSGTGAGDVYTVVTQADPNNPPYLVAYARLQQVEGDYDKALITLSKASELKGQSAVVVEPERLAIRFTRRVRHDISSQISLTY